MGQNRAMKRASILIALAPLLTAAAPPRGPLVAKDPAAKPCTHPTSKLSGQVQLQQGCVYDNAFVISSSNTTLDCNGAQIAPTDKPGVKVGGEIDSVTVKNCYVVGGLGIAVTPPKRLEGESNDDYRKRSPTNIVVTNVHVTKSTNVGIYIHHHVVGALVKDSIIEDNNRPGMYLGAESQGNTIRNNLIRDNGFRSEDGGMSIAWNRREGIAVDASAQNVIEDNQLENNAFGGILLYKNCWEHAATNPNSWQRIQHSHSNVVRNNRFSKMGIGVWVAARQARDLTFMECGDPTPYKNPIWISSVFTASYPLFKGTYPAPYLPLVSIWPDYAEANTIEGNTFEGLSKAGIRIEDDQTTVTGNLFLGDFEYIYLGSPFRANLINKPVDGTSITDNSFASPASQTFDAQLALVPNEHTGTTLKNNLRACYLSPGQWAHSGDEVTLDKPDPRSPGSTVPLRFSCLDGTLTCIDPACATPDAGPAADSQTPDLPASVPDAGAADLLVVDAGADPPSTSSGCGIGATGRAGGSGLLALLALALLALWRR